MARRVLLFGGSGFIGRHVRARLAGDLDGDMRGDVDGDPTGDLGSGLDGDLTSDLDGGLTGDLGGGRDGGRRGFGVAARLGEGSEVVEAGVRFGVVGVAELAELLAEIEPDVVVNCAGAVGGDSAGLAAANVSGPADLVAAMLRVRPGARLIHLGSAAEYGRTEPGVPISEETPARPVGEYGLSKLAGTMAVLVGHAAGLDAVVLRVFNPVGAGMPANSLPGRLAAELIRAGAGAGTEFGSGARAGAGGVARTRVDAGANGAAGASAGGAASGGGGEGRVEGVVGAGVVRLGALDSVRDFVDVRDVAWAVRLAVECQRLGQPVLNLGSGKGVPVRELVDGLVRIAGFGGKILETASGSARSAAVPWQQADLTGLARCLGWTPRTDLAGALDELWQAAIGTPRHGR